MDNHLSQIMAETYAKEDKIQKKFFAEMEHKRLAEKAKSGVKEKPPTPPDELPPVPPHKTLSAKELEIKLGVELSKNMWRRCNPAYNIGTHGGVSSSQDAFVYDELENEPVDKKFNRKRDEFVMYVEARARYSQVMGGKK